MSFKKDQMASKSRFQRTKAPKGAAKRISCVADGTRNAARVASFFVFMGALSSLLIPGRRREMELAEVEEGK